MKKYNKSGFTIIELMFSTMVFSAVLLLCLAALIQIGRMYYKGVTTSQTQQAARTLLDELTQSIQFNAGSVDVGSLHGLGRRVAIGTDVDTDATGYFCIGSIRYTFAMDRMQGPSNDAQRKMIKHAFWVDEPGQCAGVLEAVLNATKPVDLKQDVPSAYNGRDMLSENLRLIRLSITQPPGSNNDGSTWMLKLTVAYGEDDLLVDDPSDATRRYCQGAQIGTQFCAFSELSTIVKKRIQ